MANSNKDNKAAAAVALLQKNFEEANEVLNTLPADATEEQKSAAEKAVELAKKALAKPAESAQAKDSKKLKVKFKVSPTGKFGLAYSVNEVGSFNTAQATELVEAGYAEFVK